MATTIPIQKLPQFGAEFDTAGLVFTPADAAGMDFANTGKQLVYGRASAAGPKTAVAVAAPGPDSGRAVDVTGSAATTDDDFIMGPFQPDLYNVAGKVSLTIADAVAFELAVVEFGIG